MHTPADRPNILWIVSEDCPPWFGCYGDELAVTPASDGIAARGVLYERAYSPAPVCSPSRFGLITGIAPECHSPADRMRAIAARPAWMATYPESFHEAGYYCTNNSKTDYNLDVAADTIWDESSRSAHWRSRPDDSPFLAVFNYDPTHESSIFDADSVLGRALAQAAPQMLARSESIASPVSPDAVHLPRYLPDTPEVRDDFARYHGIVAGFDAFIADLLGQLAEDGLTESTIIVLTSDHGGVTPRSKRYLYEEGLHVPLVIAVPSAFARSPLRPGTRWSEPVSTLALPPTLLGLAGIRIPTQMAQKPLTEIAADEPTLAFSQRGRMDERFSLARTVRSRRYRYIRHYTPHRAVIQHQAFAWNAAGYRSWEREHLAGRLQPEQELWWHPAEPVQLYDLAADPDEVENLAGTADLAAVEEELREALREHILANRDNGFLPEDSPHLGWDAVRRPHAYPLERILDLADRGLERDITALPEFVASLTDDDPTIRRWAAIGLLWLAPDAADSRAVHDDESGDASAATDVLLTAVPALQTALADEPTIVVPAAEALARIAGAEIAYESLARVALDSEHPWARLEAIGALTSLDTRRVLRYRSVVEEAASSGEEYLGNAGRYLLFRLDGTYTPDSPVFDVMPLLTAAASFAGA